MGVKEGDKVKVHYTGTLEDGEVFDSSEKHGQPLEFEVGAKQMIPGFEKAVIGMEKGDEKEINLEVTDAYGDVNPQLIQKMPKDKLPPEVKVGSMLAMTLPNGQQMPVKVTEVGDKEVTVDMNHPLAGKKLNFKIKVVEITPK